jgi:hypothetical protein
MYVCMITFMNLLIAVILFGNVLHNQPTLHKIKSNDYLAFV